MAELFDTTQALGEHDIGSDVPVKVGEPIPAQDRSHGSGQYPEVIQHGTGEPDVSSRTPCPGLLRGAEYAKDYADDRQCRGSHIGVSLAAIPTLTTPRLDVDFRVWLVVCNALTI